MVGKQTMSKGNSLASISMGGLMSAAGAAAVYLSLLGSSAVDPGLCTIGVVVLCFGLSLLTSGSRLWSRRFLATALLLWGLAFVLLALFSGALQDVGALKLDVQPRGLGRLAILGMGAVLALLGRAMLRGQVEVGRPS